MSDSNLVHITVASLSGAYSDEFDIGQKLQDVIDKAFLSLDIKPAPGEDWQLSYEGRVLGPQTTIEEQKIPDGATLRLAVREGGGGCQ